MLTEEQLEPVCETLLAEDYRRLWLEDAHTIGMIAETLAEALGWQPSDDELLPNALMLAGAAADRLAMLEAQIVMRHGRVDHSLLTISVN